MKLYKQTKPGVCDIIAIEDVFSFLHKHKSFKEIKNGLHRFKFGTWLPEIGNYLEKQGVKTKIISNDLNFESLGKEFEKELNEYKKKGIFEDRIPTINDIKDKPIIINVDAVKIRGEEGPPGAHYVVVLKEKEKLYLYDGWDKDKKVEIDFETLYSYSLNIDKELPKGMWLFVE